MNAKLAKELAGKSSSELSQMKAAAGNDQDLIDTINAIFEQRAAADANPAKVKVRAKGPVTVDGVPFVKDQEGIINVRQFGALSRFFDKVAVLIALGLALFCAGTLRAAQTTGGQTLTILPLSQTNTALSSVLLDGNTNCLALTAAATNYYINVPNVGKYGDVYIYWSYKLSNTGTDTSSLHFSGSGDGSNYITAADISLAANGTTTVAAGTNLTINAMPYLRLDYLTNASARSMSNITIKVTYKPSRFGL